MLKVLLVDDEVLTIKMLQNIIEWEVYGLEIVATATDGLEAYEQFITYLPDIIITDIKMPNLNGIDFIQKVRSVNAEVEFILVSAHADFEYVKKAMKLGCSDYILKPIDEYELTNSIKKIVFKISGQIAKDQLVEKSKLQMKKNILSNYMKTGINVHAAKRLIKELRISFHYYHLMNISISNDTINEYENLSYLINTQMDYIVKRLEQIISEHVEHLLFEYDGQFWMVLIFESNINKIITLSQKVIEFIKTEFGLHTCICFSNKANSLEQLPLMYSRVLLLNRYSFYQNDEAILGYGYNCAEQEFDKINMIDETKNMSILINQLDTAGAIQKLNEVLNISHDIGPNSLDLIYEFCYEVILTIKKILTVNNIVDAAANEILNLSYEDLMNYVTMKELKKFMIKVIQSISNSNVVDYKVKYTEPVEQSIEILKRQYDQNISLDDICNEIAVSKNYFCYLFKREVGQSVWSYLTDIRINKAKELLENTDMKSYEIAFHIGYDNPSYFSKVFKKYENVTPNEYRQIKR